MDDEKMKQVLIDWFDSGHTLKDLMKIVMNVINNHDYKDH